MVYSCFSVFQQMIFFCAQQFAGRGALTFVCRQFVSGLQSSRDQHAEGEGLNNEILTQRRAKLLHLPFVTLHNDIQHVYDICSQQDRRVSNVRL